MKEIKTSVKRIKIGVQLGTGALRRSTIIDSILTG